MSDLESGKRVVTHLWAETAMAFISKNQHRAYGTPTHTMACICAPFDRG